VADLDRLWLIGLERYFGQEALGLLRGYREIDGVLFFHH
jgi:hypothetical protein